MKNKQFEEWYLKTYRDKLQNHIVEHYGYFLTLPWSMQWGVYLEFFDSVGIDIFCHLDDFNGDYSCGTGKRWTKNYPTRTKAQQQAIKKAFEILEK